MSKNPYNKVESVFGKSEGGGSHKESPIPGQLRAGKPSCLGDRKGRFSGTGSDLRSDKAGGSGRFTKSAYKTAGPVSGGGAGHTKQPKGHGGVKGMKHG